MKRKKTQRPKGWRWTLLAWSIHAGCATAAVGDEFLDMSLEELVDYRLMSMSRKEQRVADMAAAAYVISAEEIHRSGAQSIPEALRLVPGLNVAQISRNRWAVSSRGFNERFSNKLLVQVDGRSIYSPLFSGVFWETQESAMEDIERIEVIRGPGAALWGTNAINGVINIVTRSAAASQGTMLSTSLGTGSLASASVVQGAELAQGGHYKVFAKTDSMAGSPERNTGAMGSDAARQQRLGFKVEPLLDSGKLSFKAEAYRSRSHDVWGMPSVLAFSDPGTPFVRDARLNESIEGMALQARYAWKGSQGQDNVLLASLDRDRSILTGLWGSGTGLVGPLGQPPQLLDVGGSKTDIDVDFQQRRVLQRHDFIWGLNLRQTSENLLLPATPYLLSEGRNRRLNYSAFVHDEITLAPESIKLILGSKFEKDGLTGFNIQPNVRLLHTPSQNEAYWAAISRSVRSSRRIESLGTVDIYAQDAHSLNPQLPAQALTMVARVTPLANAAVQAEQALSLEGGWRRQFSNFLSVDASVFVTDYSHLRSGRVLPDPVVGLPQAMACLATQGPGACYFILAGYNTNSDKARSAGGELSVTWHPRSWWKVQAAYSHLRVKGEHSGDPLGDIQITAFENSAPRHQLFLHNNFNLAHNLNLDVRLRYNTQTRHFTLGSPEMTPVAAYTGLDMRLAWKVNRNTELSLLGRNLLRERHTEFISFFPVTRAYDAQRSALVQAVVRF